MKHLRQLSAIILAAACSLSAWAWGQKGHDTVAYIAECHLTPATADSVSALLDGHSPVYWANWLDNASHTPEYAYTKTWHYKNINEDVKYEDAPLNKNGDVVTAAREQIVMLTNPVSTRSQKELALKILIHIIGDMHQPMHMGRLTDLGGNKRTVRYFDRQSSLHSIWDTALLNSAHAWSYTEWRQQIDRLNAEEAEAEAAGNIDDWARQTHKIAVRVYNYFPENAKVSYNEVAAWTPVIEQQLLRGGLRLARILNAIFDPASQDDTKTF